MFFHNLSWLVAFRLVEVAYIQIRLGFLQFPGGSKYIPDSRTKLPFCVSLIQKASRCQGTIHK